MPRTDYQRKYYKDRYANDPIFREKMKAKSRKHSKDNPDKNKAQSEKWSRENPEKYVLLRTKTRAKQRNLEFNLELSDIVIPERCPVLGIPLIPQIGNGRSNDNSPSIDRVNNTKGYIKGNVLIVSNKANTIKNNASIEELGKVYEFYKRLI